MKFFTGCVAAATLALAATAAQAQVPASGMSGGAMIAVSDFEGPYGPPDAMPPPPPRYGYGYGYEERGPAPALLPATEVYAVLRENGFSPLGIPRLRGALYTIAVIDRRGDDGRLVIDARDGRIIRFMPAADAYGMAPAYEEPSVAPYRPQSALPPPTMVRGGPPRPPALDSACRQPHRSAAQGGAAAGRDTSRGSEAGRADGAACPGAASAAYAADGRRAAQARRGCAAGNRRPGQAASNDSADAGDAGGTGAGLICCG